jgi:hypothetical protein
MSRLTRPALAEVQAAWQRRLGVHTRILLHVPEGWGKAKRRRQVHWVRHTRRVCRAKHPSVLLPYAPPGSPELYGRLAVRAVAGLRLRDTHVQHASS